MKARRSPWTLLAWPASLLAILLLIWISGYLYWQIRIGRAIAELKKGPAKYENQLFYADPDLLDIGSRGLYRMLQEYDEAASRGDEEQGFAFACAIQDLIRGADEVDGESAKASGSYDRTRERPTLAEMREACKDNLQNWPEVREWYAPWWKWWKGHRGRRE